jgi:hypothetical protein
LPNLSMTFIPWDHSVKRANIWAFILKKKNDELKALIGRIVSASIFLHSPHKCPTPCGKMVRFCPRNETPASSYAPP